MIKLEFYVPVEDAETVKSALFAVGAGKIGNYDCCSWETPGNGQFRPGDGSNPFTGEINALKKTVEIKVEMVCDNKIIDKVVDALKNAHPYEMPAYSYWPVQDE